MFPTAAEAFTTENFILKKDLFTSTKVYIPFNIDNKHWGLIIMDNKSHTMMWIDSLSMNGKAYMSTVFAYLKHRYLKYNEESRAHLLVDDRKQQAFSGRLRLQ